MTNRFLWTLIAAILLTAVSPAQFKRVPLQAPANPNPQLYKADANAAQDIRRALASAGKQHKNVLLDFGGNWCIDCHILENAFHQPRIAPLLNSNYIVVHVDVGKYEKNLDLAKKYHVDLQKGVPSLAVLDSLGKVLYGTSDFERAHLMSEDDVIQFLYKWKPSAAGSSSSGTPAHSKR
ncbi:MAG: thioredoxin family protein [Acidobacteriia bacterium]|nr:thioredoxin family protein [Terriglobia bacterium]